MPLPKPTSPRGKSRSSNSFNVGASRSRCQIVTYRMYVKNNRASSKPKIPIAQSIKVVMLFTKKAPRLPNILSDILPPSVLPRGRSARAFDNMPTKPAIAKGWSGSTASGDEYISAPFPKKYSTIPPPRALERNIVAGKAGRWLAAAISMDAVISKPPNSKITDTNNPVKGPEIAKSKRDLLFGGGDRNGVIAP
jgi:hypothetical protein